MKAIATWTVVLWFALAAEQTRPDLLPVGCMIIPCAVGCMLWLRNAGGMIIAGSALLLSWILTATGPPLEIAVAMLLTARSLTNRDSSRRYEAGHAAWLQPLTIVVLAEVLLTLVGNYDSGLRIVFLAATPRLVIAIPTVLLILFVLRLSEEFGFRETLTA